MSAPQTWQFNLPPASRPSDASFPERWYPGIQDTWSSCTTARRFDPIEGIRAVVIHATAGESSEGAVSVMRVGHASFHWLVPDENEDEHEDLVWACAPEARAAWHVRNSCHHPDVWGDEDHVNHFSLGIEIVNNQKPADTFSDWQVKITAEVVRYCWSKYPNLRHVVAHAKLDPDRRSDPGINFPWKRFRQMVLGSDSDMPLLSASVRSLASVTDSLAELR